MSVSSEPNPNGPTTDAQRAVLDSLHRYACLLHKEEKYEEAETAFRRVIELEPENPRFVLELGWTVFKNRQRLEADRLEQTRPWLEKAIALAPDSPRAHYCYAVFLMAVGDPNGTEDALRKALEVEPDHELAKNALDRLMKSKMKMAQERPAFLASPFARPEKEAVNG